jgi:hypothetical protein
LVEDGWRSAVKTKPVPLPSFSGHGRHYPWVGGRESSEDDSRLLGGIGGGRQGMLHQILQTVYITQPPKPLRGRTLLVKVVFARNVKKLAVLPI